MAAVEQKCNLALDPKRWLRIHAGGGREELVRVKCQHVLTESTLALQQSQEVIIIKSDVQSI